MKVIVRCAHDRVTKAEMEREIEKLFQENKDLRLSEAHLRDELRLVSQQSEVRRQKMVEKDALIEELNEQITAQEEELKEASKHSARLAEVCAQRDNFEASYKQVTQWWGKEQSRAEEYHIALIERDYQVEELEEQLKQMRSEKEALADVIHAFEETRKKYEEEIHTQHVEKREWMQKYEELKAQKDAEDEKSEKICTACNELYEDVLSERDYLRKEVERLTYERDTAVKGNAELIEENAELLENLDAATKIRIDYAQEIDRLRKVVTHLQSTRFTTDEFIRMIARELVPSTDK